MWHIVAFDLPVDDKAQQKIYRTFRKKLLEAGYHALQKSIYYRWFDSSDKAQSSQNKLLDIPPPNGDVFTLCVSDSSLLNSLHITDSIIVPPPNAPEQWIIF